MGSTSFLRSKMISLVATFFAALLAAPIVFTAQALSPGDDIPWEAEFASYLAHVSPGADPNVFDIGNGVPDYWEMALAERVITDVTALGHDPAMLTAYSANLVALQSEATAQAFNDIGFMGALAITAGGFSEANAYFQFYYGFSLTPALYAHFAILDDNGDLDGDGILNKNEHGTDVQSYISNALTPQPPDSGAWESQWVALATHFSVDPNGTFLFGGPVPDRWILALMNYVITTAGVTGHDPAMVTALGANKVAFAQENPSEASAYGDIIALLLTSSVSGGRNISVALNGVTLTTGLYTQFPILRSTGDVDGDAIQNRNEGGATLAQFLANATSGTPPFVEGGDIPWEAQWMNYVNLVGPVLGNTNPATIDAGNGVPDYWESALDEYVIMNPVAPGHDNTMVTALNQNFIALRTAVPQWVNSMDVLAAMAITSGAFHEVNQIAQVFYGITLNSNSFVQFPIIYRTGDLDGDGIRNQSEGGIDAASYVHNATTPYALTDGGDIPWEDQWNYYVSLVGPTFGNTNPQTIDAGDGVPDYWQAALIERIITDPTAPGHQAGMVAAFMANRAAFRLENPGAVNQLGMLVPLGITGNIFALGDFASFMHNGVHLTAGLYTEFSGADANADTDGDGIPNGQEYGYDASSYVANVLTGTTTIDNNGGTIGSFGGLDLVVPPSAFDQPTPIGILQTQLEQATFVTTNNTPIDGIVPGGTFRVSGLDGLVANQSLTIVLQYQDANQDGIVDGTSTNELDLVVLLRIPNTNEMVNLGGVVDPTANTVTATLTYDVLHGAAGSKAYDVIHGTAKSIGDQTFVLGEMITSQVPISSSATALTALVLGIVGIAILVRYNGARNDSSNLD